MTRRRLTWVAIIWVVAAGVTTGWVMTQAEGEVTASNALLVGVIVATVLAVAVAGLRRKSD